MNDFDITPGFVSVSGGGFFDSVDAVVKPFIQDNYKIVFAGVIVLVIVIGWMWMSKPAEKFNPGQTIRAQQRDDQGATNDVQNTGVGIIASEVAINEPKPGSVPYAILHSSEFNCAGRTPATSDAWSWMTNVMNEKNANGSIEGFTSANLQGVPVGDNKLSQTLAGH